MTKSIAKYMFACIAAIALMCTTAQAKSVFITQSNLVSDLTGVAQIVDPNLVDAWGLATGSYFTLSVTNFITNNFNITNFFFTTNFVTKEKKSHGTVTTNVTTNVTSHIDSILPTNSISPVVITNSFFWIAANQTDKALVYAVTNDSLGNPRVIKQDLEVTIPGAFPSGLAPNPFLLFRTNAFTTNNFIFATEDGTISGWSPADFPVNNAEILTNRSAAVYKGIAVVPTTTNGPVILVANFSEGTLDEYGGSNLVLQAQFTDPLAPVGYAPFNVQYVDGIVFVTFAKQDVAKIDDVPGQGNGLIDIFNPDVKKFYRFTTGTGAGGKEPNINSPYAVALTPVSWGSIGDMIVVGNFGDGTITLFNDNGKSTGKLQSDSTHNIVIPGLWELVPGAGSTMGDPNSLYFTSGSTNEDHGIFGVLVGPPAKVKKK